MNTSQISNRTIASAHTTVSHQSSGISRTVSTRLARTVLASLVATALTAALVAQPAAARQDPGQPNPSTSTTRSGHCQLQRVGTELVRCDDLTGNGVPAPGWVDER